MIILKCGILIIHQEYEFLNQFDEYYYDEFSGLSPIASTELIDDFTSTARKLKEDSDFSFIFNLCDLFKELLNELYKDCYKNNYSINSYRII